MFSFAVRNFLNQYTINRIQSGLSKTFYLLKQGVEIIGRIKFTDFILIIPVMLYYNFSHITR